MTTQIRQPKHAWPGVAIIVALAAVLLDSCSSDSADSGQRLTDTATVTVTITGVNDAPVLTNTNAVSLGDADVSNVVVTPVATSVAVLVANAKVSDVDTVPVADPMGVAVTGSSAMGGHWEFSLNSTDGADGTWHVLGEVSSTGARVLGPSAWVRLVPPTRGTTGMATLQYRAWDGSDGSTSGDEAVDVEADIAANAQTSAFSTATAQGQHAIVAVNDPPDAMDDDAATSLSLMIDEDSGAADILEALIANDSDPDPGVAGRFGITSVDTSATAGTVVFDAGQPEFGDETLAYSADVAAHDSLAAGARLTDTFTYTVTEEDTGTPLAAAQLLEQQGDIAGALIEYKNAVQADPDDAEIRFALGKAYLAAWDPAGAREQFERARSLGMAGDELNRAVVRTMVMSGKLDDATAELAISGDLDEPEWILLQGLVDFGAGLYEDARQAFALVIEAQPDNLEARQALARAALALEDAELAREAIGQALSLKPDDVASLLLKGGLDFHEGRHTEARDSYAKALNSAPENQAAHFGMATVLVALEEPASASQHLDALGAAADEAPRALYLRALIARQEDKPQVALRFLRSVLQVAPQHRKTLAQAAEMHFQSGEYAEAEKYLKRLLELDPTNEAARRALGAVRLAAGRLDIGIGPSANIDIDKQTDPRLLALLGSEYLKHGYLAEGERSLARAHELAPDAAPIRTQLALTKLNAGKIDEALVELNEIREQSPDFVIASIVAALAHQANGDLDAALALAGDIIDDNPESPVAHNLRAYLYLAEGERDKAAQDFETALSHDADFYPAQLHLAKIAAADGDLDTARQRLQIVLGNDPHQADALMGLGALALQEKDDDEAVRIWREAIEHNPDAVEPRAVLVQHYRQSGRLPLAVPIAEEFYELAPELPAAQFEYVRIMLETGKPEAALTPAEALAARYPESPQVLLFLAQAYNRTGNEPGLEKTLNEVIAIAPDSKDALVGLAGLAIKRGDFKAAHDFAGQLLESDKQTALGHELAGDIYLAQGESDNALQAFEKAYELGARPSALMKLDAAERRAGADNERLEKWMETHPDDVQVRFALADKLQTTGRADEAIGHYEHILEQTGENAPALNNLAWLYEQRGEEQALEFARRAYEAAPRQGEIADTYGWILLRNGQHERALKLLEIATELAPANREIRYHLARAFAAVGDDDTAAKTLETLLQEDTSFPSRGEAETLLSELKE